MILWAVGDLGRAGVVALAGRGLTGSTDDAGRDVRIAHELIEKARAEGVSLVGPDGLLERLTKSVLESVLNAELDDHRGYEKGRLGREARVERTERLVRENSECRWGRYSH